MYHFELYEKLCQTNISSRTIFVLHIFYVYLMMINDKINKINLLLYIMITCNNYWHFWYIYRMKIERWTIKIIFVPRGLLFLDLQNVVTEQTKMCWLALFSVSVHIVARTICLATWLFCKRLLLAYAEILSLPSNMPFLELIIFSRCTCYKDI